MKMISRQRSSTKRKLLAIVLCAVLAVVLLKTPVGNIGGTIASVQRPLTHSFSLIPNAWNNIRDRFHGVESLRLERDNLIHERNTVTTELVTLKASITDYEALRLLRDAHQANRILAGVLIAPNISPYDSLVLDRGTADYVPLGAIVYANENIPIGVVTRVEHTTSIVELFSSPGMTSHVFVLGPNIHAKAIGVGGGTLDVLLPHGVVVKEGDAVILPTLGGEHIGTVAHIKNDPAEPGATASVIGKTALSSLRFVSIAKDAFTTPTRVVVEENIRKSTTTASAIFMLPPGIFASTSSTTHP